MVECFSTGSILLDLALGGGWARGRIFNIVGDKSSGKTLLAIEAFANFSRLRGARMRYAEAEAAFDDDYAAVLGFPSTVTKPEDPLITVEAFNDDLEKFIEDSKGPSLYILDSLDALSDEAEMERKLTDPTYGANKAKQMSAIFRKGLVKKMEKADCCLGVISQIRDRMDVMMGESKTRAGGRALDFYASHIVWLAETGKIKRTVKGQDRAVGVDVHARVKKCKVGMPFREVDFQVVFGYGVDDEASMIEFLKQTGEFDKKQAEEQLSILKKARTEGDKGVVDALRAPLKQRTLEIWKEIEKKLAPPMRKY